MAGENDWSIARAIPVTAGRAWAAIRTARAADLASSHVPAVTSATGWLAK
jgi:hypothetical protein